MSVRDVPRAEWAQVIEEFSRAHRGWRASLVTVRGSDTVSHTGWYPLGSVAGVWSGRRATSIRIGFQGGPTVCIGAPRTLGVDRREDGAERALEIDAAGGTFVRLAFRATARLEEMDGLAPAELVDPCDSFRSPGPDGAVSANANDTG
jgi:hypothetical protein